MAAATNNLIKRMRTLTPVQRLCHGGDDRL